MLPRVRPVQHSTKETSPVVPRRRHVPDNLDTRIAFISRPSKLLVAVLMLVIAAIGVWSVTGKVRTFVHGSGLLMRADATVYSLQSEGDGRVVALNVRAGDAVLAGSVVAEIHLPALELDLDFARARRDEAKAVLSKTEQRLVADLAKRQFLADSEPRSLTAAAESATRQLESMKAGTNGHYVTSIQLSDLRARLSAVEEKLLEARSNKAATLTKLAETLAERDEYVRNLERRIAAKGQIRAPVTGTVREVQVNPDQTVNSGDALMTIVRHQSGSVVLALFPIKTGGRITKNMLVHVVPGTVPQDRYGGIIGHVKSVTAGPVTSTEINLAVGNADLVRLLSEDGSAYSAYIAHIELEKKDAGGPSQFVWTSGDGPPFPVTPGTPAEVWAIVEEQSPIELIVPALREVLLD